MEALPFLLQGPAIARYAFTLFLFVVLALGLVRWATTVQYQNRLRAFLSLSEKPWPRAREPPQVPYAIPWLGNTFAFLDRQQGRHWQRLFSLVPRAAGVCSLLVGGKKMHVLFSPYAIQALFKDRKMKRDDVDVRLYEDVFRMSPSQSRVAMDSKHIEHEINVMYLLRPERVNELTAGFIRVFDRQLRNDVEKASVEDTVNLYQWLRPRMFAASTNAFFGENLLREYPSFCDDFFGFDQNLVALFFNLPGFLMRDAIRLRTKLFHNLARWNAKMYTHSDEHVVDPEGPEWEPLFGSRYNRARQITYRQRKLDAHSISALDLGASFGLNTNAIPATGWMLMHILNPDADPTLHPRVMAELKTVERPEGSIDVAALTALPLLQSIWTETLRFYVDILVLRNILEDTTLPLDEEGKRIALFKKGSDVVAPTWIARDAAENWTNSSARAEQFWPERFLVPDPEDPDKMMFSSAGVNGKLFPFGGGRTVCPGRVFAKQEALGALALVLLKFDFDVQGFVDVKGKPTAEFPSIANAFPGVGTVNPSGDLRVRIRRRQ